MRTVVSITSDINSRGNILNKIILYHLNKEKYGDEEIKFSYLLNMVEKKVEYEYEMTSRKLLEQFYKLISFDNESQIESRLIFIVITDT